MPVVESTEYDLFDYRHADETPLSLEEAVDRATILRLSQPGNFHRIVQTDRQMTGFRVESVSVDSVEGELLARWSRRISEFILKLNR